MKWGDSLFGDTKKNHRPYAMVSGILLALLFLLAFSGCAEESQPEDPLQSSVERTLVPAASDELRTYSYDPASTKYVEEKEGKERIQVFVRVDYPKSTGSVVAEDQIWEVRLTHLSYKVVVSKALDADGNLCPT